MFGVTGVVRTRSNFRRWIADGDRVDLITESTDGVERIVRTLRVVGYSFPTGRCDQPVAAQCLLSTLG